jgi:uncharacterized membrane protein YphA (DoxX/SURF4 family)
MDFELYNHAVAYTLARVILGVLFLLQAYDKIFKIGLKNVVQAYSLPMNYLFSDFWIWSGTVFTSYAELICGPLLILGLFTNISLYVIGIDMIIVVIALGTQNPMWDMKYVFPRLLLVMYLLYVPVFWNILSLDYILFNR